MSAARRYALVLLAAAACAEPAPDDPTWVDDVRPILAANCVRCHRLPAAGGAPAGFRLDKYGDTTLADGTVVRGAAAMAQFVAARAGELGDMPPDAPRTDEQRDTLVNWWARAAERGEGALPALGDRANTPPTATLLGALAGDADDEPITVGFEIADADGDLVDGALVVDGGGAPRIVSTDLRSGRGAVSFDPATLPDGDYDLAAVITDDLDETTVTLGSVRVAHAGGNTAPQPTITAPRPYELIADLHSPFAVVIEVDDPDTGDGHTVDLVAVRGDYEREIAVDVPVVAGGATIDWATDDPDLFPDGIDWRLRATVSDGAASTAVESGPVIVSHTETDLTFDEVQPILASRCGGCHPGAAIPGLTHDFGRWADDPTGLAVNTLRGLIYLRIEAQRTMPPPSAHAVLADYEPLTEQQRATIAEYLLGGAQE